MTSWLARFGATGRRDDDRDVRRLASMSASIEALSGQLKTLHAAVSDVANELRVVQKRTELLIALREADANAPEELDRLERAIDSERVISHLGRAVTRGELAEDPIPHLIVSGLLPDEVYRAIVAAVPAAVFFDGDARSTGELPLPLTLAPVHSMAAWTFVARVIRKALGSAVVARFEQATPPLLTPSAPLSASRGRLARRRDGEAIPGGRRRATHVLTTVVPLVAAGESVALLLRRNEGSAPEVAEPVSDRTISLPANSALTFLSARGTIEFATPTAGAPEIYTYEFPTGPLTKDL